MDPIPETPAIGPDEDRRVSLEGVVGALVAFSTIFMGLRIWARTYSRILGTDDLYMAACWLTFVALGVSAILIGESGGTRHFAYLTLAEKEYQIKLQVVLQAFGIPCTAFGKIAVAFTILRIINQSSIKWHVWSLWVLIILTALTSALDVLLVLFQCGDPANLWDLVGQATGTLTCLDKAAVYNFNTFTASFQAFADFYLALLPIHIIWHLQMPLRRKLALVALLGLTTFTGIAAVIKTVLASKNLGVAADPTWDLYALAVWAAVEITLIVVCGSVPALAPLWERFVVRRRKHRRGYRDTTGGESYMVSEYNLSRVGKQDVVGSKQSSRVVASAGNSVDGDGDGDGEREGDVESGTGRLVGGRDVRRYS
ncbi:hypothetical protein CHGG_08443 [Chaetomium globosum CBS 148.51]|uniref:Rhodopsin domain-containing protein n=1 Tax=Chaetomium globosum (strain ATCC 6205 / CBS 148.51 / DSM 1962 / NBRC 6347 / NRRL 1970) TaxID=306901 RepID=Q2GUB1_CHAGB|nr:uncharacterized protein CHGG_08443 [Chaetomium globosum CBS 148.51]EAQ84429.1 hypothetical protein CHGG_08443 [Chaetomium globosum CBS 148.51]